MADELEIVEKLAGRLPPVDSIGEMEKALVGAIGSHFPELGASERAAMAKKIASYGPIAEFMEDPAVEDVMINGLNPIFIYRSDSGMVKTEEQFESYDDLELFMMKLLLFSGKSKLGKVNDLNLPGCARANIVSSPLGPQITIRRFKGIPPSIIDLVDWGMLDYGLAAKLWLYTEGLSARPANILITGPPASGKTTLLNSLFSFFPANQRIIVIEDTMELNTKSEENCARLASDEDASMEKLVKNSLRMRPDRIIIGEVRGAEAKDLMTAMNIGKICMGTMHAGNAREAVMRLENEPMNVPGAMVPLIDVIINTGRFAHEGEQFRRITGVSETAGMESGKVLLAEMYKFDFQGRKLVELAPSVTYRDRLASAAGVTPTEVLEETKRREQVLRALKKKGATTIEQLSLFCKKYNEDPEASLKKLGISD